MPKQIKNQPKQTQKERLADEEQSRAEAYARFLGNCALPKGTEIPVSAKRRTSLADNLPLKRSYGTDNHTKDIIPD